MSTRRGFLVALGGTAAVCAVALDAEPALPSLRILVGDRFPTDLRVWLNGIECGGAIPATPALTGAFKGARVGDVLWFEMFDRDEKGNCFADRETGGLRKLTFRARVVDISRGSCADGALADRQSRLAVRDLRSLAVVA